MKLFWEYTRTIVISLEFLILILTGMILSFHPAALDRLLSALTLTPDVLKWLALIPSTCMALTLKEGRKVLFPEKDKKDRIQKWDQYCVLRVTVNVAVFYAVVFTGLALPAWIVKEPRFATHTIVLMASAILGAGIDYLSVYNAEIKMNESIAQTEQNTQDRP